jgi:hypothetical protein
MLFSHFNGLKSQPVQSHDLKGRVDGACGVKSTGSELLHQRTGRHTFILIELFKIALSLNGLESYQAIAVVRQ